MALMVGELAALLSLDNEPFERSLMGSSRGMDGLKSAAVTAAVGIGAAFAAGAVYSLAKFSDFEAGMNEVFTLLPGISQSAMDDMTGQVQGFSREFGVLPDKVIPALYQSLSAGVPPGNVFDFLETSQKLARAGATDLETAVDGLTSTVNAYGAENLSAAQASDIMVTAVRVGKTTVGELSDALFQVNPIAASAGVGFGDVAAALSTMTAQGVPTSVAATQLRGALSELSTSGSEAATTFEGLSGQTFRQFVDGGGTMQEALQMLAGEAENSGGSVADMFGSVEAGQAALALTGGNAETFAGNLAAMGESAGATDAAYATMTQGIKFQLDRLKAWFSVAAIQIGGKLAEIAEPALRFVADLADAFSNGGLQGALGMIGDSFERLSGPMKTLVAGLAGFAGVLAAGGIIALVGGLAAAVWGLVSPVALVVVGIAALAAAVYYAYTHFEGFRTVVDAVVGWLVDTAWPAIQAFAAGVAEQFSHLVEWTREHWDAISEAIGHVVAAVQAYVGAWVAWFRFAWATWGDDLVTVATAVWDLIKSTVENAITIISGIIDTVLAVINGDWSEAWDGIRQVLSGMWDQMKALVGAALVVIGGVITGALSAIGAYWSAAWNAVLALLVAAWEAMKRAVSAGISAIVSFVAALPGRILSALASLPGLLVRLGLALMHGLLVGVSAGWGAVSGWLAGLAGRVWGAVGNLGSILVSAGQAIINGLWSGMKSAWGNVTGWLGGLGGTIRGLKGPIEKDRVLLEPIGQAIIGGLDEGMRRRWAGVRRTLAEMTGQLAATALPDTNRAAFAGMGGTTIIDESRFIVVRDTTEAAGHAKPDKRRQVAAFLEGRS